MALALCLLLAYAERGLITVLRVLDAHPVDQPGWARRPTAMGVILGGALWWYEPIYIASLRGRVIPVALLQAAKVGFPALYLWFSTIIFREEGMGLIAALSLSLFAYLSLRVFYFWFVRPVLIAVFLVAMRMFGAQRERELGQEPRDFD
jgi:hypothetical protein